MLHSFSKQGFKHDTATLCSCSMFSWDLYLVFSAATAEKPVSQMLQKEEECPSPSPLRVDTASLHSARIHPVSLNLSLNVESGVMSMNWSSSAELKAVGTGALKGSLTQSFWELSSGKYFLKNSISDEVCCFTLRWHRSQ